ncbi:MAG: M23 family metallopeptidase [Symbiobacteriia bacterium]
MRSFRVPLAYVEAGLAVLGLAGLAMLIFANSYQRMTTNMGELRQLRQLTADQRQQLDFLSKETETVQESLKQLEQLDQQVRQMMKLAPKPQSSSLGQGKAVDSLGLDRLEPNYRPNERDVARIAAAGGSSLGGGSLETSGLIASLDPKNSNAEVSRGDLEVSAQMLASLEQTKIEIETRQASMQQLQTDIAEKIKYLAAKPSGWPVYGQITSPFGYRSNPYGWGSEFHPGVDIAAPYGSEVRATGDGTVTESGWDGGYGKKITINHGYGFVTVYGHNSRLLVDVGQHVKKGQVIAYVGMTGRTTGPHVHYEIRVNGSLANPVKYLAD